jgi:hypothetical protein
VERIAEHVRADRVRLAQLFREVDALKALQSSVATAADEREQGYLIAARDREEEERDRKRIGETDEVPGEQERDDAR